MKQYLTYDDVQILPKYSEIKHRSLCDTTTRVTKNYKSSNIIKDFVSNNSECNLKPIIKKWGFDTGYGRQILTGQDNMDGFFYACLTKNTKC